MRKNIFIFSLFAAIACFWTTDVVAQEWKVVESSAKKAPKWVGAMSPEFVIASEIAPTIEQAKEKLIQNVQRQIIGSVATNIKSSFENQTHQTTTDATITDFTENVDSKFATQAAKLPFVNSISMSKVADFYWEKQQDKQSKAIRYVYSIQYPFTSFELKKMVMEFNEQDAKMNSMLEALQQGLETYTSLEQLDMGVVNLAQLTDYFFDDVRLNKAKALTDNYKKQYTFVKPTITFTGAGKAEVQLKVGARVITTSQRPQISSNCAIEINAVPSQDKTRIDFNTTGCISTDQNYIELAYRMGGKVVREKMFFDLNSDRVVVSQSGSVYIDFTGLTNSEDGTTRTANGFVLSLQLTTQNNVPFTVEGINFSLPVLRNQVRVAGVNQKVAQKGMVDLAITSDMNLTLDKNPKSVLPLFVGELRLVNDITGEKLTLNISSSYNSNL